MKRDFQFLRGGSSSVLVLSLFWGSFLCLPKPLRSQSAANSGQVVGQVLDPSAAAVAGAEVTARNKDTNFARTVRADAAARYSIALLPLGAYEVTARAQGFAAKAQEVYLTLGSSLTVNFTLAVGGISEQMTVTAEESSLEPTRPAPKSILTDLQIHNLPSNGRRLQNLVIQTPTALIEPECRGYSISGQKGIYGNVSIDGGDYNSTWSCGLRGRSESAPTFGLEGLREIHVVRNTFSSEFGRSTGGQINMSTKSGTNQFHGSSFYLIRDGSLTAEDAFARPSLARVHQFGGSFGGPLVKDRTFFFTAPEFQNGSKPVQVIYALLDTQGVRNTPAAEALLAVAPEGEFSAVSNSQAVIHRLDHHFSPANSFYGRFDFTRTYATNSPGATALSTGLSLASTTNSASSFQTNLLDRNYTVVGQLTSALSSSHLNELRLQFSREIRPRAPQGMGPQVNVNNGGSTVAIYGPQATGLSWGNVGFASTDNRYHFVDNFSIVSGAHSTKIGVDYQRIAGTAVFSGGYNGNYQFSSLANFLARRPNVYTQFTGTGTLDSVIHSLGFYVQDEWRVLPSLTISPGFRYEAEWNPDYKPATVPQNRFPGATAIPDDARMFAPRLGLAWNIGRDAKTVVRAGGGFFYAPTFLSLFAQTILFNGGNPELGGVSVQVTDATALASAFQSIGVNLATAPLDNLPVFTPSQYGQIFGGASTASNLRTYYFDPEFRNPRAAQFQVGLERQISSGLSAGINYTYINTVRVARQRDTNLGVPAPDLTGRRIYPTARPLGPKFGISQITESAGRSLYRGFTSTVNLRRSRYTVDVYYTRSWNYSYDDVERGFTSIALADANEITSEYHFSNIDEPHQFLVNGNSSLPFGWDIGTSLRFVSGRPFTARAGSTDLNRDGQTNDRPVVDGVMLQRNTFRNRGFQDVSLRVQKNFVLPNERGRLSFSAELFNLFNFDNVTLGSSNMTYGAGTTVQNGVVVPVPLPANFRQLRNSDGSYQANNAAGDPFQLQLGLRFQF